MLVGCHNGAVACVLIVETVRWSLPLEPECFNPHESWADPPEGIRPGVGQRVPLTLRRTKLLSQRHQYHSTYIAWHRRPQDSGITVSISLPPHFFVAELLEAFALGVQAVRRTLNGTA